MFSGYTLKNTIHVGKHYSIYLAMDDESQEEVVIKATSSLRPTSQEYASLRYEFELMKELKLDTVVTPNKLIDEKQQLGIVFRYQGEISLDEWLKKNKLNISSFLSMAIQITDVISEVHLKHIIHKDIKPGNILVDPDKLKIKLTDFSIATSLSYEKPRFTKGRELEGTLSYISPEQTGRMNRTLDYRTDFYSLGVTFYYMLTGKVPFTYSDPVKTIHAHIAETPQAPHKINHSIPEMISNIVMKLMEKNAENRYQSSYGLRCDLVRCKEEWSKNKNIAPFKLGQDDAPEYFAFPQKIYGRAHEINLLLKIYESLFKQECQLLTVTGVSGIGKSSLVNEVNSEIVKRNGFFITGKYEQYQSNNPYSAIIDSLHDLITQILSEDEKTIEYWKNQILQELGDNAGVIAEVLPELKKLIGEPPKVLSLGLKETENRFKLSIQKFIALFTTENRPLIMFLDDLQWADFASIKLIELLFKNPELKPYMIIGAYRDNEVDKDHPLMIMLSELFSNYENCHELKLSQLNKADIQDLLIDLFKKTDTKVEELAEICLHKTGGNPFFIKRFIRELYDNELIVYDRKQGQWNLEIDQIKKKPITENIIDLIVKRIKSLDENSRHLLQLATCIGNRFNLSMLADLTEFPLPDVIKILVNCVEKEFIFPLTEFNNKLAITVPEKIDFKFAHDRIQQAVYAMIDKKDLPHYHLEIAKYMEKKGDIKDKKIFDLANQYNQSLSLMKTKDKKKKIVKLNLIAGKKAINAIAYKAGLNYLTKSIDLLPTNHWQKDYSTSFDIYSSAAKAAFLLGQFEKMEEMLRSAQNNVNKPLDKIKLYEIELQSYIARDRLLDSIKTSLKALELSGEPMPLYPKMIQVVSSLVKAKRLLKGRQALELSRLPVMTDPLKLAAMRVLAHVNEPAYIEIPNLWALIILKMFSLSVRYGNMSDSAYGYVCFGVILSGQWGKAQHALDFAELGKAITTKFKAKDALAKISFTAGYYINAWRYPYVESFDTLKSGYEAAMQVGDLEFASLCLYGYDAYAYYSGKDLKTIYKEITAHNKFIQSFQRKTVFYLDIIFHNAIKCWLGEIANPRVLGTTLCTDPLTHQISDDKAVLCKSYITAAGLCYSFYDYKQAQDNLNRAKPILNSIFRSPVVPYFYFYDSLTKLQRYNELPIYKRLKTIATIKYNQLLFKSWADFSPQNFMHKYYLVEAEKARVFKKNLLAQNLYQKALELVNNTGLTHEIALVNEVIGKFYLEIGFEKIARPFIFEAYYQYEKWQADSKINHMKKNYQQLLAPLLLASGEARTYRTKDTITATGSAQLIDVESLSEASQTLSQEIEIKKLITKVLKILVENTGAEEGMLLLKKHHQLCVEGIYTHRDQHISHLLQSVNFESLNNIPRKVIRYVLHSNTQVVLNDAEHDKRFQNDSYIKNNGVKSVLALPIIHKGEFIGCLYFENNLAIAAFTEDRVQLAQMLSTQVAISIENARLYHAFSQFVPHDFLQLLEQKNIVDIKPGDSNQMKMTVMFTDIRNFTEISEGLSPKETFKFLNDYLKIMEPFISKHHGFIDKYIGDAIMSLFPNKTDDALNAIIEMHKKLQIANEQKQILMDKSILIGSSINSGSVMLGTVGGTERIDATVVGDIINTASRIEALNKVYGTQVLISNDILSSLEHPEQYHVRIIDKIQLRGKKKALILYELLDVYPETLQNQYQEAHVSYQQAWKAYQEKEFKKAMGLLEKCQQILPQDVVVKLLYTRCKHFLNNPPPDDWNGIINWEDVGEY